MSTSVAFPAKSLHPVAWMKCHAQCPCVIDDVDEGYATRFTRSMLYMKTKSTLSPEQK